MKRYDYLIVGSGLFGATFAYCAMQAGHSCLVIERRSNTGGNVYCKKVEGINVHCYGPHVFHTSDVDVWKFVTSLVPFNRFTNTILAQHRGRLYNLPFNMNTFYQMWGVITPQDAMRIIGEQRGKINSTNPRNLEEQALMLVGRDIYETLIKGYTEKQWGRKCRELPSSIIRRLPVRFTYDNNYFDDVYQGIPVGGYNRLINRMLYGADVVTDADFFEDRSYWESFADKIVYTGSLDKYFDYQEGHLEWRSIRFEHEVLDVPNYQGNAIVNYTDSDVPYTRIVEHKHFEYFGQSVYDIPKTVITREYPVMSDSDPYYPINDERNNALAVRYRSMADTEHRVIFGGRLAEYRYYDMDDVIASALTIAKIYI